jgi:hypothetical protein
MQAFLLPVHREGSSSYFVDYVAMRRLGGAAECRVIRCFNPSRVGDLNVTLDLLDGHWASRLL